MSQEKQTIEAMNLLPGGGEMGAAIRNFDWSKTPLGAIATWSLSLRTAVNICLNSRFPMVIWWGPDLVLLYNDAWQPILGSKHPQALGRPGREVWAEIWDIIGTQLEGVLTTKQATWSDDLLLIVDRHGYTEEAYFTYSYSPIYLETGQVGGAFTAVTETTQRVLGERRLATLQELAAQAGLAKTVEQAYLTAIQTLAANPKDIPFALLYQVQPEAPQAILQGSAPLGVELPTSPESVSLVAQSTATWPLATVVKTGQAILVEALDQTLGNFPSGPWHLSPRQALVLPIRAAGQELVVGVLVVGANPCRVLDEDYQQFFEMVAGHVATAIANARAYQEERQRAEALAELDRAKTTFFNNISHEFRTPLTLMLGPAEDALTDTTTPLPAPQRERLEIVQRNGLRLLKLVNTLLDFSRIEAGRTQAIYEPTDLANLTQELASVFRSTIERAGLRLQVDCPALPAPVYIDREMWEKIVLNLLSNAFKFTLTGEISVSLHWVKATQQTSRPMVVLEVRDTGIGIPADELPHLFERFHRVKGAQGRTLEGSGIGLSLVKELVQLHGGKVEVTSVVNAGSCFTVSIPAGIAHLPSNQIGTRPKSTILLDAAPYVAEAGRWVPETDPSASREPLLAIAPPPARILLADDNADMRDYVRRLLSQQQYRVETVADGVAALAAIRQEPPDLVLTDVMMPGVDGFELLRSLRADPQTREIPIILLSARAGEESRIEGLEAGADDYLIKPFSARELLARVEATLKMAQLRQVATHREQGLRIEAELAQKALTNVLAGIHDQFITLDHNWCYLYVNDQVAEVVGRAKQELLGRNIWELFPNLVGSKFYTEVHRAVAEQTTVQFEYFYSAWSRWFENRVYPSSQGVTIFVAEITDRKLAEAALQESEARFRLLAENSTDIISRHSLDGTVLYISPACYPILGYRPEELIGQPGDLLVHPEDQAAIAELYSKITDLSDVFRLTHRVRHRDGHYVWIEITIQAIQDPQTQEFRELQASARDITPRKQAEARLQFLTEASDLLAASLNDETTLAKVAQLVTSAIADCCVIDIITDGQSVQRVATAHADPTKQSLVEQLSHHPPQIQWLEGIAKTLRDGKSQVANTISIEQMQAAAQNEQHLKILQALEPKAGISVALIARGQVLGAMTLISSRADRQYGPNELALAEELAHRVAIAVDNTRLYQEAQQAQQAAERAAERTTRLQTLTAALAQSLAPAQVAEVILEQGMAALNADCALVALLSEDETELEIIRAIGYNPELVETWRHFSIHAPAPLAEAVRTGEPVWGEATTRRATRYPHLVETYARYGYQAWISIPLMLEEKAVGGLTLAFKETQEFSHEDRAFILAIAQQCAQAIERAKLYAAEQEAREAAEAANRIKDEFLAVLSHELRSPLNPILGWSKLLRTRKFDPQATERALETIERNAKLQAQLIEDLLDVSRILQGKMVLEVGPVNLCTTIEAALEIVRLAAEAKGIQIQTLWDAQIGQVTGDPNRLQQIFWNLLSNAIKFTPPGGKVQIIVERIDNQARIQVKDTGEGISPDFLPHVFEYFRQKDGTTTRRFGGLGLGLAIVRHLTELHGGTVMVSSQGEGLGATFTVKLPIRVVAEVSSKPDLSLVNTSELAQLRILLVDDEPDIRELLLTILETYGAEVITATSAAGALAQLDQGRPDLLISDVGMPDVDGYMLIQQIRSRPTALGGDIPAIALTAYAGEVDRHQALNAGFQEHLAKPVDAEDLVKAIAQVLGR